MMASLNPIRLLNKQPDQVRRDPVRVLPLEIFLKIFTSLRAHEVYFASQVSKEWHAALKASNQLWKRCAAEFSVSYPRSMEKRHDVAWIMYEYMQGLSALVFTNSQLDSQIVNYFRKLSSDESGRVVCRIGQGKQELIFRASARFIFRKVPDLLLGMPGGISSDQLPVHADKRDSARDRILFTKRSSYQEIELRAKTKRHWVQIKIPPGLEQVFLERFKCIAARLLLSLNRRAFWAEEVGCIIKAPYHIIKYNDIVGEHTDFE